MWDLTYGLMTLTPFQSGYYGFITGVTTTGALGGAVYYGRRNAMVHITGVLRKAVHVLNSTSDVRIALGGAVTTGDLAAFRHQYGTWKISSWKPVWSPAKLEALFTIHCGKSEGIVSVIATQQGTHSKIEFLGVDILNGDNLRILVTGDGKDFAIHDSLRSKVTFK